MLGRSVFISSLLLSSAAFAQDYFPLDVGNVWVYKTRGVPPRIGEDTITVEVRKAEVLNGVLYFQLVDYRSGAYWVRNDGAGRIVQLDEKTGEEKLWYDFTKQKGEVYVSSLPACCGRARVVDRAASKETALGKFENALLQLDYPGVFQVGITEEDFLPYVGLIFRSENTGGPSMRSQELVYARLSGVTVLNASGIGFGVTRGEGYVRLSLNNNTGKPMRIVFSSGQTLDVIVRDAKGGEVYRWSEGKVFTQALRPQDLPPGETNWVVALPPLVETVAGPFTVEGSLLTVGGVFRAVVPR